jgi:hypothetical protein
MQQPDKQKEPPEEQFRAWFTKRNVLLLIGGYLAFYVVVGLVVRFFFGEIQNPGIFGDMFGAVNAFVSGLAMLGVVAAILLQMDQNRMQSRELQLQRAELEQTRQELKGQKEALQRQHDLAKRTAEADIMSRLMVEYDKLRQDVRAIQDFYKVRPTKDQVLQEFARALAAPDRRSEVMMTTDPARFAVSRFFVRIRKLEKGGYLSREIIWSALGRAAIEDVFLALVDPLDQVVNETAKKSTNLKDRLFFQELVDTFGPTES